MFLTITTLLIILWTFKKDSNQRVLFVTMLLVIVRQFMPVMDFENFQSTIDKGEWDNRKNLITSNIVSLVIITMVNFGDIKGIYILTSLISIVYGITYIISNDEVSAK